MVKNITKLRKTDTIHLTVSSLVETEGGRNGFVKHFLGRFMIKWMSNTNLYPRFDVFFSAGYTDDLFPFMSMCSQFLSRGWPKNPKCGNQEKRTSRCSRANNSYLQNKTAELLIKFLHCFICWVGIATLFVWKPISMFTCGAVFLELLCHQTLKTWSIDETIRNSVPTLEKKLFSYTF